MLVEPCHGRRNSNMILSPKTTCASLFPLTRERRAGNRPGLFEPPSSPTTSRRTPVKAAPSSPVAERPQHQQNHHQQQQQQRAKPTYLALTASSRHKHKRGSTNLKAEANLPVKTQEVSETPPAIACNVGEFKPPRRCCWNTMLNVQCLRLLTAAYRFLWIPKASIFENSDE